MPKPTISTCIQATRVRGHSGCLIQNSDRRQQRERDAVAQREQRHRARVRQRDFRGRVAAGPQHEEDQRRRTHGP